MRGSQCAGAGVGFAGRAAPAGVAVTRTSARPTAAASARPLRLLELDSCARAFELCLGLLGVFLRDLLEDGLRSAVDEVLGLLQPEARERPDLLDDLDLLLARGDQDDVELVLLLGCGLAGTAAGTGCRRGNRDGGSRRHAELLLERLEE